MANIDKIDAFLSMTKLFMINKAVPSFWLEEGVSCAIGKSLIIHSYNYNNSIISNQTVFTQIRNVMLQKSEEIYFANILAILKNNYNLEEKTVKYFEQFHSEILRFRVFNDDLYNRQIYLTENNLNISPLAFEGFKENQFYVENYIYGYGIHSDNKKRRTLKETSPLEQKVLNNILISFVQSAINFIGQLVVVVKQHVYPDDLPKKNPLKFSKSTTITEAINQKTHLSLPFVHGICKQNVKVIFNHGNGVFIKFIELFDQKTETLLKDIYLWGPPKSFIIADKYTHFNIDTIDREDRYKYLVLYQPETLISGVFYQKPLNFFEGIE